MGDIAQINFERDPRAYRHWALRIDPPLATLTMVVDPEGGLPPDYSLGLNSCDLDVDIGLADVVPRLRFEHPEVHAVVLTGGLDKVFSAGANVQMLARDDAPSQGELLQVYQRDLACPGGRDRVLQTGMAAAINGTAAGGGYELALACDEIVLVDDRSAAVSVTEVPLMGVLPGMAGFSRLVDKRQ